MSNILTMHHNKAKEHRVIIKRDSFIGSFGELYASVWILGDADEEAAFAAIFSRAGCYRADSLEEADIVVFTGGPDVDPVLYGEACLDVTHFSEQRDKEDLEAYKICYEKGIPMVGICRGAQFLHVMNGGKLYQDVSDHNTSHYILDCTNGTRVHNVSSVHHQMCMPNPDNHMEIIAVSHIAKEKRINITDTHGIDQPDIEAFFYRDTCCLGFQGHPEYKGYAAYTNWFTNKILQFISHNPDLKVIGNVIRLPKEHLQQRDSMKKEKVN